MSGNANYGTNFQSALPAEVRNEVRADLRDRFEQRRAPDNGLDLFVRTLPIIEMGRVEQTTIPFTGRLKRFQKWNGLRSHGTTANFARRVTNFKFDNGWFVTQDDLEMDRFALKVQNENRELATRGMELLGDLLVGFLRTASTGTAAAAGNYALGLDDTDWAAATIWPSTLPGGDDQPIIDNSHVFGSGTYDNHQALNLLGATAAKDLFDLFEQHLTRPSDRGNTDFEAFPVTSIICEPADVPLFMRLLYPFGGIAPGNNATVDGVIPNFFAEAIRNAGMPAVIGDYRLSGTNKAWLLDELSAIAITTHPDYPGAGFRFDDHYVYDRDAWYFSALTRLGIMAWDPRAITELAITRVAPA